MQTRPMRIHLSSLSRGSFATFGKIAFALAVFCTTVGGYSYAAEELRSRRSLPDSGGRSGRCAVWLVGSSSIHRWQSAPADLPGWYVHNRGLEGAEIEEVRSRLGHSGATPPPSAMIFYVGENDIARGMSGTEVAHHLIATLDDSRRRSATPRLFVVSMKPSPARWAMRPEQLRFDAIVRRYAETHPSVVFLDEGRYLLVNGRPGPFYQPDGVHLSPAGYGFWGKRIATAFERHMPREIVNQCQVSRKPTTI